MSITTDRLDILIMYSAMYWDAPSGSSLMMTLLQINNIKH